MIISIILLAILFYLGVECGASWPWSSKWQTGFKRRVPEIITALILGGISVTVYSHIGLNAESLWGLIAFLIASAISFAGIEAGTWSFLQWDKDDQHHTPGRSFTLKPIVDWIADRFDTKLGDEKYAWISAGIKGSVICLPFSGPLCLIGGFLFACGYEVGSHAKGRVWFNPAIISEGLSFLFVGILAIIMLQI